MNADVLRDLLDRKAPVPRCVSLTGRSGEACSAAFEGRQAPRGGDGLAVDPLEWASEARSAARREGVSDGSRRGETPSAARCAARRRVPASPALAQQANRSRRRKCRWTAGVS